MPNGEGGLSELEVRPNQLAHKSESFFTAFGHMLLTTRPSGSWNTDYEAGLFQMALKKKKVTVKEAYDAFFAAYGDPYVGKGGIAFRHLWKHIEKARYGEEGKLFTYEEMLNYCDKNSCSTDVFTMVSEETDSQDRPKWALK